MNPTDPSHRGSKEITAERARQEMERIKSNIPRNQPATHLEKIYNRNIIDLVEHAERLQKRMEILEAKNREFEIQINNLEHVERMASRQETETYRWHVFSLVTNTLSTVAIVVSSLGAVAFGVMSVLRK